MQLPVYATKSSLIRSITRESFWEFVQEFWEDVVPEPMISNFHLEVVSNELQDIAELVFRNEPKQYDLLINIPPGTTKSTITSIMFGPWIWSRMPTCRILGGSFDDDLAMRLANKARRLVKTEKYQAAFPEIQIREDQDTKSHFENTLGGERKATSTGASITGRHFHIQTIDDPLNPAAAKAITGADLKTANEWMSETLPSRCVDRRITPLIVVMQRLAVEDPSGVMLQRNHKIPIRHICLPAELQDNVSPGYLAKHYQHGLLDPIRLSQKILDEQKVRLGSYAYAGQYDQRPVPLSGGMFHWAKLQIGNPPAGTLKAVRSWDKAGTADGSGARTAGVKIGDAGPNQVPRYWILDVVLGRWDASEREQIIRQTAQLDGRKVKIVVEQEPGSGGKESAENTVRNLVGFIVRLARVGRADGDKFERADPFSVQVNSGNVGLARGPWNQDYLDEIKVFGIGCKYKDQVDATANGFNFLVKDRVKVGALWK